MLAFGVRRLAKSALALAISLCGCSEDAEQEGRVVDAARACCDAPPDAAGNQDAARDAGVPDAPADAAGDAAPETSGPDAADAADAGACNTVVQAQPSEGATHIPDCTTQAYVSNPPSSGPHWGTSAAHGVYNVAVPRESLVHNLEHGAVVIWYNCSANCTDVSRAEAFISSLPLDPICPQGLPRRVILVPDPLLDVPIAASAWGFTLRANCFDEQAFADFFSAHYGQGLEPVCFDGWDFETPSGALVLPPTCP